MKKRCLILLSYILFLFSFCLLNVKAAPIQVYQDADFLQLTYVNGSKRALLFYMADISNGTNTTINDAALVTSGTWNGIADSTTATLSVRNGSYKAWVYSSDYQYHYQTINVTNSCTNDPSKLNQTGSFSVERCFKKTYNNSTGSYQVQMEGQTPAYSCASGYTLTSYSLSENTCSIGLNGLSYRYCKGVFKGTCTKNQGSNPNPDPGSGGGGGGTPQKVPAPKLSALSVSTGSLSPAFKSGTYKYTVNVGADVSSIKVSATAASGNSLVSGYGSRTVDLKYGSNSVVVKVKNSAGTTKSYTITVNRADNRSTVNTLSNLTVSAGTLTPVFSSSVTNYTVDVGYEVSSITIDSTLTDSKSQYVAPFGPGTFPLVEGVNQIYVKVLSENQVTNVYTITVNRGSLPSECLNAEGKLALVKGIELYGNTTEEDDLIEFNQFDPNTTIYNDIEIPYNVSDLFVVVYTEDEADKELVVVEGNKDLIVNEKREVSVVITSNVCPNYSKTYTLNVMRQDKPELNDDATVKDITIKGYKDFKFEANVSSYKIVKKKNDDKLDIKVTPVQSTTDCDITGNEELEYGSEINIVCTAQDGETTTKYTIIINDVEKGTNIFLIVILVIIIILILIYLVLRLLGYRIYFNTAMIGSFFRGMGEKAKNTFDK